MRHFAIPVVAEEQAILDRLSVIAGHPLKYQEYLNDRIGFTSHFGHVTDLILPGGIWTAAASGGINKWKTFENNRCSAAKDSSLAPVEFTARIHTFSTVFGGASEILSIFSTPF